MQLILVEQQEGQPSNERILPMLDSFTIGRDGDVVPSIGLSQLLSRIHATVKLQKDGSWLVLDGDGVTPSKNGLWSSPSERVSECTISSPGQFVDLIALGSSVLMVRVSGGVEKYDRNTTGYEEYSLESVHCELEEIRSCQRSHTERSERIEAKLEALSEIGEHVTENLDRMTKIEELIYPALEQIKTIAIDNSRQDGQIKRSSLLMKAIGVIVVVLLAGSSLDKARQDQYINVALTLLVSGGLGAAAISESEKRGG